MYINTSLGVCFLVTLGGARNIIKALRESLMTQCTITTQVLNWKSHEYRQHTLNLCTKTLQIRYHLLHTSRNKVTAFEVEIPLCSQKPSIYAASSCPILATFTARSKKKSLGAAASCMARGYYIQTRPASVPNLHQQFQTCGFFMAHGHSVRTTCIWLLPQVCHRALAAS